MRKDIDIFQIVYLCSSYITLHKYGFGTSDLDMRI